ncbi:hypothetical protein KVT40_008299 [Elsinoe batatas]|uniref:CBF1-interacting co-repressor CIR N-terminal domain-containing protein n=1 Tax=Elsinoe batatas TaxID=2601811 RepID=A0A8K0PDP8_9PEZI|nr:hypothetical protein KVT40_008299 [Elsinoe batatas]
MPLHLLGKKSWNVYNADAIARVKRDEALAAAAEAAEDERMQEEDAARRTAILRGEVPPPITSAPPPVSPSDPVSHTSTHATDPWTREERKLRRRHKDEDESSHAIRLARLDAERAQEARERLAPDSAPASSNKADLSLTDERGHITLFSAPADEDQTGAKRKRKPEEREEGVRLADAAGYNAPSKPWYTSTTSHTLSKSTPPLVEDSGRDAFGRPDPKRKERDAVRAAGNDPMAMMVRAQTSLKQAERDKEAYELKRREELARIDEEAAERRRRRNERRQQKEEKEGRRSSGRREGAGDALRDSRRRSEGRERRGSTDSLEGFTLDDAGIREERQWHRRHEKEDRRKRNGRHDRHDDRYDHHGHRHRNDRYDRHESHDRHDYRKDSRKRSRSPNHRSRNHTSYQ